MLKPFSWSAWKRIKNWLWGTIPHLELPYLYFFIAFIATNVNEIWCICITNRESLMEKSFWLKTVRLKVHGTAAKLSMKPWFVFSRVVPEVLVGMVAKDRCHPWWKPWHCNRNYIVHHQKDRLHSSPLSRDLDWPSFSKSTGIEPWNRHSIYPSL